VFWGVWWPGVILATILNVAYARMKLYDVSQLPVLEADHVVSIVDESDLLMATFADPRRFAEPVSAAMSRRVETVPVTARLDTLLPVFDRGHVVVVVDGTHFLGLITRIISSISAAVSTDMSNRRIPGPNTRVIHGGQRYEPSTGAVAPPIYATSTFVQSAPGVHQGWEYARLQNPTRASFEAALAGAEGVLAGFAFASGLAAESAVLEIAAAGSHVVASEDLYGGS
jgi:hypothetical protein